MFVNGVLNTSGGIIPGESVSDMPSVCEPPSCGVDRAQQDAVVTEQRIERSHKVKPSTPRREVLVEADAEAPLHESARPRVHLLEPLRDPFASEAGDMFGGRNGEPVVVNVYVAAQLPWLDTYRLNTEQLTHLIDGHVERLLHVARQCGVAREAVNHEQRAHLGRLRHLVEHALAARTPDRRRRVRPSPATAAPGRQRT